MFGSVILVIFVVSCKMLCPDLVPMEFRPSGFMRMMMALNVPHKKLSRFV